MRFEPEIPASRMLDASAPGGVKTVKPARTARLVVSRRNLLTLLAKLDANREAGRAVSAVTIGDPDNRIFLHAEEDDVHYDPQRRMALGHAPVPGRAVRDAATQAPLTDAAYADVLRTARETPGFAEAHDSETHRREAAQHAASYTERGRSSAAGHHDGGKL